MGVMTPWEKILDAAVEHKVCFNQPFWAQPTYFKHKEAVSVMASLSASHSLCMKVKFNVP